MRDKDTPPVPTTQTHRRRQLLCYSCLTRYSSTESWMKVVDCTIGVRMAPVSLSGFMPWCTSLLVAVFNHEQRTREGRHIAKGVRPQDTWNTTASALVWAAALMLPGQGCSGFQVEHTTSGRRLSSNELTGEHTSTLTFQGPSPCLPAMFHIPPACFVEQVHSR